MTMTRNVRRTRSKNCKTSSNSKWKNKNAAKMKKLEGRRRRKQRRKRGCRGRGRKWRRNTGWKSSKRSRRSKNYSKRMLISHRWHSKRRGPKLTGVVQGKRISSLRSLNSHIGKLMCLGMLVRQ